MIHARGNRAAGDVIPPKVQQLNTKGLAARAFTSANLLKFYRPIHSCQLKGGSGNFASTINE